MLDLYVVFCYNTRTGFSTQNRLRHSLCTPIDVALNELVYTRFICRIIDSRDIGVDGLLVALYLAREVFVYV